MYTIHGQYFNNLHWNLHLGRAAALSLEILLNKVVPAILFLSFRQILANLIRNVRYNQSFTNFVSFTIIKKCRWAKAQQLWPPSWKDKRPQIHLYKSMAMHVLMNYYVFNGNTLGKIVWISSWGIWLPYPRINVLATANSILYQTARLVIGRCFKLTNSPCIFERCAVTSPTTLVSKGRHCHWD